MFVWHNSRETRDGEKRKEMEKEQKQNFLRRGISVVTAFFVVWGSYVENLWSTAEDSRGTMEKQEFLFLFLFPLFKDLS